VVVDNTYHMIQGMQWCVNNKNYDFDRDGVSDGPDIISLSMGVYGTFSYLDNAAGSTMDNGVVFVTSAGNDGPNPGTVLSPATSPKVIAVGATDKYNKVITSFSSRGPGPGGIIKPNVVAPGLNLILAYPGNTWTGGGTGTSFSCPIVAGICALLLQYDPDLDPYEIKKILEDSAEDRGDSGPDNTYGWGFVDTIGALDMVLKVKSINPSSNKVIEDTSVSFTVTASGTNVKKYEWDWDGDGIFDQETTENTVAHKFTESEVYTINVRITNQQGKSAQNSVDITVTNREPDAKMELDGAPEFIFEDEVIQFNASASWDTPSDIKNLEFSWSFNSGSNFTNFSKDDEIIGYSFNKSGDYSVIVKVRDDDGEIDDAEIDIVVENLKPVADAGDDRTAFEYEPVLFTAMDTIDTKSDLETLNYTWKFGDGKKGYGMNVSHHYEIEDDNETFTVTLTVVDNDFEQSTDKIKITVQNQPPTVIVDEDIIGIEDQLIALGGIGNDTDNDYYDLEYKWTFDDGSETEWIEDPRVSHTYTQVGTYHPRLYVKDSKDAVNSRSLNVTIKNQLPTAKFKISKSAAVEDELITFDASGTIDTKSDLDSLTYVWDFGDGSIEMGKIINHRYYKSKRYTITLTVYDDDSASSMLEKKLTVSNQAPSAKISTKNREFEVNDLVRFFGYRSSDTRSDLRNLTYYWDFRDGTGFQVAGMNTTFKYPKAGEYTIRLKVEDDDRETDMRKVTITIFEPEVEENMYENPTFENKGLYIYTGVGIFIVILIILLVSLLMYYKNKRGMFGILETRLERRRRLAEERRLTEEGRISQIGGSGLTVGQEDFYQELYGVHPTEFQNMSMLGSAPGPGTGPSPGPMPMPIPGQPFPPPGMGPAPGPYVGTGVGGTGVNGDMGMGTAAFPETTDQGQKQGDNILQGPNEHKAQPQISKPENIPKLPPAKVDKEPKDS
jgi:chitodextrinase